MTMARDNDKDNDKDTDDDKTNREHKAITLRAKQTTMNE